jgi:hypothetical protein
MRAVARQQFDASDGRNGSKASFPTRTCHVRYYPNSDRLVQRREMTLCAISDQSAAQQNRTYSITSFALTAARRREDRSSAETDVL